MGKKREVVYKNGKYAGKYLTDSDCIRLENLLRLDKEGGLVEDLKHVIHDLPQSAVDEIISTEGFAVDTVEKPLGTLKNQQTVGVAYMYFAKRLLLGDSVGLGKTVEVAGLVNLLTSEYQKKGKDFRVLFLTDKTIADEIRGKMVQFTGCYVDVLYGEKAYVQKFVNENGTDYTPPHVVGVHSLLKNRMFQDYLIEFKDTHNECPFDLLVVDESGDVLTNTTTQYYKEGKIMADMFERVVLLNATPFGKKLREFYAQLNFIDDTLLPTKTEFSNQYEIMEYGRRSYPVFSGKYKNADEFQKLVGYRYLKRTRKDLGAKMEGCSAELLVSSLSKEQKNLLKMVSMPTMVYDCPSYFPFSGVKTNRYTTPKINDLILLVKERFKLEKSILVYSRYKEAQYCIKRELDSEGITAEVMNGETSITKRNELIKGFKLGDFKVLVTNVQKGLDFGDCNVCIFYDYDPSPSNMVQFEGRTTRSLDIIGKTVILLVSKGNELKVLREIVSDRAQASELFSGSEFSCVLELLKDCKELKVGKKEE